MVSQKAGGGVQEISAASKTLLYSAGACFALFGLYIVILIVRVILRIVSSAQAKQSKNKPKEKSTSKDGSSGGASDQQARGPDLKTLIKQSKASSKNAVKEDPTTHHELFLNTLKGHQDEVMSVAWSADGKVLATACTDNLIRLFDMSDPSSKDPKFRRIQTNGPAVGVGFGDTPEQMVAVLRGIPNVAHLVRYELRREAPNAPPTWSQVWQEQQIHGKDMALAALSVPAALAGASTGTIFSLSSKKEGRVFSMQGRAMGTFEPNSLANHELAVSSEGRFIAVASFTADVKVWEVQYARDGFKGVERVMELKGHNKKVMGVSFSPDSKRVVTASEDGTLRVWNIEVRYHMSEDPKVLLKVPLDGLLPAGKCYSKVAYGPGGVIAAAFGTSVHMLRASDGALLADIHAHDGGITCMRWCTAPAKVQGQQQHVLATSSSDRRVRLWRAPVVEA